MIAALIAHDERPLEEAVAATMARIEGAFAAVLLSEGKLVGFRDPDGIRPLALGQLEDDCVLASEGCAFDLLGAEPVRELQPGELVVVDADGVRTEQAVEPRDGGALCIFEFIYFARPDSTLARRRAARRAGADGRAARRRSRRSRPTSSWPSPTRARLRRSASRARAASRSRRG